MGKQTKVAFEPHPDGRRVAVENVVRLDVSKLAWAGIIEHGMDGDLWPFAELEEESASLCARGHDAHKLRLRRLRSREIAQDQVQLIVEFDGFSRGSPDDNPTDEWMKFDFVATRPNYGGRRWWFKCDGCDKLRAFAYLVPCLYPRCRECLHLTYETRQYDNHASRHGSGFRRTRHTLESLFKWSDRIERRSLRRRVTRIPV